MDLPSSPPLYALANAHFLLAGPVLGLLGTGALWLHTGAKGWRPFGWLLGAKALSTAGLLFPLSVAFSGLLPHLLGQNPLGRLPWLGLAFGALLLLLSSMLEWPFFYRALAQREWKTALALSFRANAVCLALLMALYLPFCDLSLLGASRGSLATGFDDSGTQVFYLRAGALFQRGLEGPEKCLGSGLTFSGDARLFARRGENGWDLWLQERDRTPYLVQSGIAPSAALAPPQSALHVKLKKSVRTTEPALPECFGKPAEAVPETDSAWAVQLREWPREGLRVESRDLRERYRLALDTPLLSWVARCGTRLPGERLLFQMGPYLWLLELETKRLRLLAKGQGAQAVISGAGRPGSP